MVIMIGQWLDGWSLEGLDGRVQQTTLRSGVTGGEGLQRIWDVKMHSYMYKTFWPRSPRQLVCKECGPALCAMIECS